MPRRLGPQPSLATRGVTNTEQDISVLDKAFALIEGHPRDRRSTTSLLQLQSPRKAGPPALCVRGHAHQGLILQKFMLLLRDRG